MKKVFNLFTVIAATIAAVLILASCGGKEKVSAVDVAKRISFPFERGYSIADDFYLESSVIYNEVVYEITYTSDNENVKIGDKVEIDNTTKYHVGVVQTEEQQVVNLTATVKVNGEEGTTTDKFRVARQLSKEELIDVIYNQDKGQTVSFLGHITYISGTNYYVQADGFATYLYGATANGEIKVGDHVKVAGTVDEYNGARQLKAATIRKYDDNGINDVKPIDVTERFIFNENTKLLTGVYATLSNVKVTDVKEFDEKGSSTQTLVTISRAGVSANIVITKYLTPFGQEAANAVVEALSKVTKGTYINVSGFVTFYNGAFQLQMVNGADVATSSAPEVSDKETAQTGLNVALSSVRPQYIGNKTIKLPVDTDTLHYEYALTTDATDVFTLSGNTLTIKAAADVKTATLNVKATVGNETVEGSVTIVSNFANSKFEEFIKSAKGDTVEEISGTVTYAYVDKGYAYVIIQDDNGAYYLRFKCDSLEELNKYFEKGYKVTGANGVKDIFNGLHQLANTDLSKVTKGEKTELPEPKVLTEEIWSDNNQLINYLSSLVKVTVKAIEEDGKIVLKMGSTTVGYYADKKLAEGNTPTVKFEAGKTYEVTGFVGCHTSGYQINPNSKDAVVEVK